MNQDYNHLITPPPELVEQWLREWNTLGVRHANPVKSTSYVAIEAAQWGADQELEACCKVLEDELSCFVSADLRTARRPKPPSLKEQAIAVLEDAEMDAAHYNILLRALEQLPDPS